nr:IS30 family transposase [Micromonospora parva]
MPSSTRCRSRTSRRLALRSYRQAAGVAGRVQAKLEEDWSPQQIAAWLRQAYPDQPSWHVCHETIYQALYRGGRGGLSRQLTRRLRTGRPLRKRRRRADPRRCRFVAPTLLIEHRPAAALHRTRIGDWEGDLIVGRQNQSAIATLVDRTNRYLRLVHLPVDRTGSVICCKVQRGWDENRDGPYSRSPYARGQMRRDVGCRPLQQLRGPRHCGRGEQPFCCLLLARARWWLRKDNLGSARFEVLEGVSDVDPLVAASRSVGGRRHGVGLVWGEQVGSSGVP